MPLVLSGRDHNATSYSTETQLEKDKDENA